MTLKKKNLIKIPSKVKVYYNSENNAVLIKDALNNKVIKFGTKLIYLQDSESKQISLYLTSLSHGSRTLSSKERSNSQRIGFPALRQALTNTSTNYCKKLKLFGVGYKVLLIKQLKENILHLKLGYSHSVYFKLPKNLSIEITKKNFLFLSGNSLEEVSSTAAAIRKLKLPEPYKGKGILYVDEKIQLKIGKKV